MAIKQLADRTMKYESAQTAHVGLLPPSRANTPVARAFAVLGALGSMEKSLALFDQRATRWQIIDWRLGRRGLPQWAAKILRAKLNAQGALCCEIGSEIESGPGMGWNKNATRGLGEWRAKKNAEKRD